MRRRTVSVPVLLVLCGCANIVGIGDLPSNANGGGGTVAASACAATMSDDKTTPFLGVWSGPDGAFTLALSDCDNGKSSSGQVTSKVAVQAGSDSDLTFFIASDCTLPLTIAANGGTQLVRPTSCSGTTTDGTSFTFTYQSANFTLGEDCTSAQMDLEGTFTGTQSGSTVNCKLSETGSFTLDTQPMMTGDDDTTGPTKDAGAKDAARDSTTDGSGPPGPTPP